MVGDYISREDVINDIGELFTICRETLPNECGHHFIVENELQSHLDHMRNLPAADVVEVVRCRECRFAYDTVCGWCCSHGVCVDCIVREDFFCADGKRKDGGQDDV